MTPRERARERFLNIAFNITTADWEKVSEYQGGVCFACGKKQKDKRLATDHSHDSGLFRGLLCAACNALLGKIENNFKRYGLHKRPGVTVIMILAAFVSYLKSPPAVEALGREVFGYPGKIGTDKYRKWARKRSTHTSTN